MRFSISSEQKETGGPSLMSHWGRRLRDIEHPSGRSHAGRGECHRWAHRCQVPGTVGAPGGIRTHGYHVCQRDALVHFATGALVTVQGSRPGVAVPSRRRDSNRLRLVRQAPQLQRSCAGALDVVISVATSTSRSGRRRAVCRPPVLISSSAGTARPMPSDRHTSGSPTRPAVATCRGIGRRSRGCCSGTPSRPSRTADA
jgi:hypothetical protein